MPYESVPRLPDRHDHAFVPNWDESDPDICQSTYFSRQPVHGARTHGVMRDRGEVCAEAMAATF